MRWRDALEAAALPLGESAPDAEALVVRQRVLQALGTHLAARADALGLAGGAALLGEERLRVRLGAQRALLPVGLLGGLAPERLPSEHLDGDQRLAQQVHRDRFDHLRRTDRRQRFRDQVHSPTSPCTGE